MKKLTLITAAILLSSTSHYVCAEQHESVESEYPYATGIYIGGQVGYAKTDTSSKGLDKLYKQAGIDASSTKVDDDDTSYGLFLGYKFNQYFSVEAGYQDLGERSVHFSGQTIDLDAYYNLAEHVYPETADGITLSVLGTLPLNNKFSLTGKIGYFDWEMDAKTFNLARQNTKVGTDKRSDSDIWYGAELSYQVDYDMQAYISYQHMPLSTDDVGVISLGFRYWFEDEPQKKPIIKAKQPIARPQIDSDKDGVFDNKDKCTNTPIEHLVNHDGCTQFAPRVAEINLIILYPNDSHEIDLKYSEKVQRLADFINKYDVKKLNVIGHTSASGSKQYNQKLSERRAIAVAKMLASDFNITPDIIKTIGKGETELISDKPDENRRIEVYLKEELNLPILKN